MGGMSAKSVFNSPFIEKGRDRTADIKKLHFIKLTTLYLEITGLKSPRYSEKLRQFTSRSTIPKGVDELAPPKCTEFRIKKITPAKLSATPPAFLSVTGSPRKMNANIIVKIGPRVLIIAVSMDVAIDMATRKVT